MCLFVKKKVTDSPNRVAPHDTPAANSDHAQALQKQQERREREPLFYCKLVTKWPLQSFC